MPTETNLENIAQASIENVQSFIRELHEDKDPEWKKKIQGTFDALNDHERIEAVAQVVSVKQTLAILDHYQGSSLHHPKLSPLFMGINKQVFVKLIQESNTQQLQTLQHEAVAEPILHQLTLFTNELEKELTMMDARIDSLRQDLLDKEIPVKPCIQAIEDTRDLINEQIGIIDKSLAIAWNSDRSDLVNSFNKVKEILHEKSRFGLGVPLLGSRAASGLYCLVDIRLQNNHLFPASDLATDNDLPVSEALAVLSICYLKDYKEIGLLPGIIDENVFALKEDENPELATYREKLREHAFKNLERIGLCTLLDMKKAEIDNKDKLIHYIKEKKALIEPVNFKL
jgi:hypothetical protein